MSERSDLLQKLLEAGDTLAKVVEDKLYPDHPAAADWWRLRGEVSHQVHLVLDELAETMRRLR